MNKFGQILTGIGLLSLAGAASAVPIVGDIAFGTAPGAYWTPADSALVTGTATTANADGVVFTDGSAPGTTDDGIVSSAFGDYSGTVGDLVDFNDFVFDPLVGGTQLWTFTDSGITYSFAMTTSTLVAQTNNTISLEGSGYATITGKEQTGGTWSLTLNNNGSAFSFSSSASVPEPGIALLLGAGLIGLGVSRKLRKTA